MLRYYISLAGVLVFTILLLLFAQQQHNQKSILIKYPDALIKQVNVIITDSSGQVSIDMIADSMSHYFADDFSKITHPVLKVHHKTDKPWVISANNARSLQDMGKIYLWDQVVLHHSIDNYSKLLTDNLWIFPEKKIATTNARVEIQQPGIKIVGQGLRADLRLNVIKLLANVQGEYTF